MSLFTPWNELIRRIAVAAGSGAALITLLQPAPVSIACLRGGLAWVAVRLLGWFIGWVLRLMETLDAVAAIKKAEREEAEPEGGTS